MSLLDKYMRTPETFIELVDFFIGIINMLIPILMTLTIVFVVYKVIDAWVINGDSAEKVAEGRWVALVGIIVLTVMAVTWSIVAWVRFAFLGI